MMHYLLGYNLHEMLDNFDLINMPACRNKNEGRNGRAYDPLLGQFLSPDPFVSNPENPQRYNRYAYCLNNPLKYTDPSGYSAQTAGWQWWLDQNMSSARLEYMSNVNTYRFTDTEFSRQMQQAMNSIREYNNWADKYNMFFKNTTVTENITADYTSGQVTQQVTREVVGDLLPEWPPKRKFVGGFGLSEFKSKKFAFVNRGVIKPYEPNPFEKIYNNFVKKDPTFLLKIGYGIIDDLFVYGTAVFYGYNNAWHLNGHGAIMINGKSDVITSGINTLLNFFPLGRGMRNFLGISEKILNAGQFNKLMGLSGPFGRTGITAATKSGFFIRQYNSNIRTANTYISNWKMTSIGIQTIGLIEY
jgi:hypothetical protein